jgi:preprotein translocase subunit SecE
MVAVVSHQSWIGRIGSGAPRGKEDMEHTGKLVMTGKLQNTVERIKDTWVRIKTFFVEVNSETKKVTWPTFKEVRDTTIVVIIAVIIFGFFLYMVDLALGRIIQYLFKVFA